LLLKEVKYFIQEHLSSLAVFSGVRVTRSLVLCVCFVDRCLSFCPLCCLFFFYLHILITPFVSSNSSYLNSCSNPVLTVQCFVWPFQICFCCRHCFMYIKSMFQCCVDYNNFCGITGSAY